MVAAQIILDHGYVPSGMEVEDAAELAKSYIELAYQAKEKTPFEAPSIHKEPSPKTTVETYAQPPYLKDLDLNDLGKKPDEKTPDPTMVAPEDQTPETDNPHEEGEVQEGYVNDFFWIPENEDDLANFNFDSLVIPKKVDIIGLSVRSHVLNLVGTPQETYLIDGNRFRRQNVSGHGMRCLFNAMGLEPEVEISQLAFLANDPILRLMIANEIVSASATPEEIPEALKEAINYQLYDCQRTELDRLERRRAALLASQTINPDMQNVRLLPEIYQITRDRGADHLKELWKRSLTLKAYNAFLRSHMGGNEMMVALHDVSENNNGNFTSIDALGYANNIGLKIFQPRNGSLHLTHQYIPENAKEISYIFHADDHFQALVPVEDEGIEEANDHMIEDLEPEESSDQRFIAEPVKEQVPCPSSFQKRLPSSDELTRIYPDVVTSVNRHRYDPDLVRKILYAHEKLNEKPKTISLEMEMDSRRISEILISNNTRKKFHIPQEEQENLLEAYLKYYQGIKNGTVTLRELARGLSDHRDESIPPNTYTTCIHRLVQKDKIIDFSPSTCTKVIEKYLNGESLFSIKESIELNFPTILKILSENVDPSHFRFEGELQLKKKSLSEKEKEELILAKFWELKNLHNKVPGVENVRKSLMSEHHKIGYKPIERILKSKGLIKDTIKAKHISLQTRKAIVNDFNTIDRSKGGKRKNETYQELANRHEVSFVQVRDLIRNGTYKATNIKRSEANYDRVVAAYHTLNVEQKKLPARHISKTVPLAHSTINQILSKAGLYEWNGKTGKHAGNALIQERGHPE